MTSSRELFKRLGTFTISWHSVYFFIILLFLLLPISPVPLAFTLLPRSSFFSGIGIEITSHLFFEFKVQREFPNAKRCRENEKENALLECAARHLVELVLLAGAISNCGGGEDESPH